MYNTELNVDAALNELFAYARQYQYEVRGFLQLLCKPYIDCSGSTIINTLELYPRCSVYI